MIANHSSLGAILVYYNTNTDDHDITQGMIEWLITSED